MNSSMKINRKKRIITDLQRLREPPDATLPTYDIRQEKGNDLNVIYTEIRGPSKSFYEGGFFVIRFEFTNDYPVSSPSVAFQTKIWHPNVDHNSGSVCLNSLNQSWQPTVHLRHILDHHIPWLLKNGNADDPLNTDAGTAMKGKDPKYPQTVRHWVRQYASSSQLHSHGAVWYRDERRKRRTKKKKKFSIKELTATECGQNTPRAAAKGIDAAKSMKAMTMKKDQKSDSATKMDQCPEIVDPVTPLKLNKLMTAESETGNEPPAKTESVDLQPFQDWWTQSKLLPATPSQSGIKLLPSDHEEMAADHDHDDEEEEEERGKVDGDKAPRVQMQNEPVCEGTEETEEVELAHNPRRKKRRRKMKKLQLEPTFDFLVRSEAPNDGELSSMDEDPICDLQHYQSLKFCDDPMDSDTVYSNHSLTPFCPLSAKSAKSAPMFRPDFSPLIMAPSSVPMEVDEDRAPDRILHVAPLHEKE